MEHRQLGRTGVSVSKLCLGPGINFIDTADIYSAGESEVIVGKALAAGNQDEVLDRIDAINPPGVTINYLDNGWIQPGLQPAGRCR